MGAQAAQLLDRGGPVGDVPSEVAYDGVLALDLPAGYDLAAVALLHGGVGLAPTAWDGARLHLRLPDPVVVEASGRVRWAGRQPSHDVLRRVLDVAGDPVELWAACDAVPELAGLRPRVLRSPTVWQDLVGTLAGTRASYRSSQAMLRALVGDGAFPGPALVRAADLSRWGYRAPWLRALAERVLAGWDPDQLLDPALPDAVVLEQVRALAGFGPFATAQLQPLLGRPRPLVLDGWLRGRLGDAGDDEVRERFAAMGRWAGTGAWLAAVAPPAARRCRAAVRAQRVAVATLPGVAAFAAAGRAWSASLPLAGLPAGRLVWWRAATAAPLLVADGHRPATCWDLGAVHRLLHGGRRDDPAAVWGAGGPAPEPASTGPREPTLLDLAPDADPVRADGSLSPDWAAEPWAGPPDLERAKRWAALALQVQARQAQELAALPDPRAAPAGPPLALLTAYAESTAALLAVELEHDGLPVDRDVAQALLTAAIGPRPADESAARAARDATVLRLLPDPVDLRAPLQVRALLARLGIDVPDTRSWRLEPHRATSPVVAALLDWRRSERIATTYGWAWLDRHVGADGRLRGSWGAADAAAGRMTASAGLHNLPADLRPAVAAEPGHLLVRADLGQVEPRVLAVVSGDPGLTAAARERDMYAPVAAQLGCDRPTAKVAVLAAMYGQTSGAAGAALRRMEATYPRALAHLRAAETVGREGGQLRTWGGRLLRYQGDPGGTGRGARNAVVQGAAAELFKVWAATVRAGLPPLGGRIVLCLHDELLVHVPQEAAPAAADLLHAALQEGAGRWAAGSGVRFVADVAVVRRWSDAKA